MFDRPRPATVLALTTAAAISVSLTGCGDSTASASPESPSAQATHSTPAATGSSSTAGRADPTGSPHSSNTTAAGAPGVPEPARQHTTKGAIAFAKHYTDVLNTSGKAAKVGLLEPLSLKSCKTCRNYENNVKELSKNGAHHDGNEVKFHSARRIKGETGMAVNALVDQTHTRVIGSNGEVVKTYPEIQNVGLVFFLKWTSNGWQVKEIKIDKSRVK